MDSQDNPKPISNEPTAGEAQNWEYRVVHININNDAPPQPATPEAASKKLQGALSPESVSYTHLTLPTNREV